MPFGNTEIGNPVNARIEKGLRVLYYDGKILYGARGRHIIGSKDGGKSWWPLGKLNMSFPYSQASFLRSTQRLLRAEVYKLHSYGGHLVALAKGGVYTGKIGEDLQRSYTVTHGSRPISLAGGPDGRVYFGEYHSNLKQGPIRIYGTDNFQDWFVVYEFAAKKIRHIHGIFYDPYSICYWVLTGDYDHEPGIARAAIDFSELEFVRQGSQSVRVYSLICTPEGLVFATDTEIEKNFVYLMDREGKRLEKLLELENSVFHLGYFGDTLFLATVCEPTCPGNDSKRSHIWYSKNLTDWSKFTSYKKDWWPAKYFQFGNIFFPEGKTRVLQEIIYSGTALQGVENMTVFAPLPA